MITQPKALARMEEETRKDMRRLEDSYNQALRDLWDDTLKKISASISHNYRRDFAGEKWDMVSANAKGTLGRIRTETAFIVSDFKKKAEALIASGLDRIKEEERLRALWMIDQTTPGSFTPKPGFTAREADTPRDKKATWAQTLDAWMNAYHSNLSTNLNLEALNEGSADDAASEPESTRINNYDPIYKLQSMFSTTAIKAEADARRSVFDSNQEVLKMEIWQTMEDGRVCNICDSYDGRPVEELGEIPPAHFNCRCYTRFVPAEYSNMLRSGDQAEREMALRMDDAGLVPDALPIRSEKTGNIIGRAIVSFDDWKSSRGYNVGGTAR